MQMESLPQKRRRSERRRLKMLRNQDEYKMVNPFKHSKEDTFVPNDVVNQLKKLDYLTQSSVSMIHLAHCCSQEDLSDALTNMTCALQSQYRKCQLLFGIVTETEKMDSEETPKEEKEVDVHTKEEMLIFIEEPHGFIDLQMFGSSCTYEEPELFYEHEHTGNYGQLDDMVKERYCPSQWLEYEPKDSQLKILNYETDHDAPAMSRDKYIY